MNAQQAKLLRLIAKSVVEGIEAAGSAGAPAGVLYAALSTQGCTLDQFEKIMDGLKQADLVRSEGCLYFIVDGPMLETLRKAA